MVITASHATECATDQKEGMRDLSSFWRNKARKRGLPEEQEI